MMLLEHDAKELLGDLGLPIPVGILLGEGSAPSAFDLPVVVKAQVPVGGRGKAGGIRLARTEAERQAAIEAMLGMTIKGHRVGAVRLEQPVDFVTEAYLSLTIDAASATVRVLMSPNGGIDVEDEAARSALRSETAQLDPADLVRAVERASANMPEAVRTPLREAGRQLVSAFLEYEAILLEVNPLFIRSDGSWVIGDTKLIADDNAFQRRPQVRARIETQPALYPQAALKIAQDYDFVCLDEGGDIGLVTTGAGLSMQLIDELVARGRRPYNFCDIRTGMFRGDPGRLIQVFRWISEGPQIKVVLINFFAGLSDLGEIARLLLIALKETPELKAPIVARLIGNNLEEALAVIDADGFPIAVETDLERAIQLALRSAAQ